MKTKPGKIPYKYLFEGYIKLNENNEIESVVGWV